MSTSTQAPTAVEKVEEILRRASAMGASDVHLDPSEDGLQVRMRRDGTLTRMETLRPDLTSQIVGRCKALADLLVYRSDVPQEGRIPSDRLEIGSDVRVATFPTLFGEKVALRLDVQAGAVMSFQELGLQPQTLQDLAKAIEQPAGVVLLTGPSGSGKTTTLYSCLQHLTAQDRQRTILTVEDPIERRVRDVIQTQVNPAAGLDFARALRSLLRQDPEVILIGEIRDPETAAIAMEAGLTGHLVVSTVHAGTAPLVFARLLEMGVEPFALTTVVRGVLAQRLLRRRCTAEGCGDGNDDCTQCQGSGYFGRCLLTEWLPMSRQLRRAVLDRTDGEELTKAATTAGYRSLWDEAEVLLDQGMTTREEVRRVLGEFQERSHRYMRTLPVRQRPRQG